ncbi:MAG: HAD family phosphatase [Thiolinea sp.]
MTLKAILWDMDGTLINSEPVHEKAFAEAVAALGLVIPPDTHDSLLGSSNVEVHQKLVELTGTALTLDEWREVKWQYYRDNAAEIKIMPHSRAILDKFTARGTPMALVSNSTRDEINLNLAATQLADYFQVIISRNDVEKGKPAPDPYLAAAQALSLTAKECLVVEDSVTGARAGLAAGMTTLFHPETTALVAACPDGAVLLPPGADLMQWLEDNLPSPGQMFTKKLQRP